MPNNLDNFVPEIWSRRVIANIDQVNVALSVMCNTDYEGDVKEAGDTVQVRTFGSITVQDYQRGLPIAAESLVPLKETLTVDKAKYFAFDVDSLDVAQNDINAIDGYTRRAGVALSNAIDSYALSFSLSGNSANAVGTAAAPINITADTATTAVYEQLVAAGLTLDNLSVPQVGRWAIVTPYFKSLCLKSVTYFIRATELGDAIVQTANLGAVDATRKGFIGQMAGFDIYCSTNAKTNGTYWACPYGQGKPVSYAAQIPPSTLEAIRLESTFATRVRGLLLHGGAVFTEDAKRLGVMYVNNA